MAKRSKSDVPTGFTRQNFIAGNRDVAIASGASFPQLMTRELALRFEVKKMQSNNPIIFYTMTDSEG